MSAPLILGCLWVIVAAISALLPMRRQMISGPVLILTAPVLLVWIGVLHGFWWVAFGLFAFASMFRRPLIYFSRKAMGLPVSDPRLTPALKTQDRA